jgi:hypothetical protein
MARNRTNSRDFWTWEAVIHCAPMTRLLFIGLWSFADDGGVQPLRLRTIRTQVFPGDTIENHSMRAMIDELAARGLVRIYAVDGVEYVAIVDWGQPQRVGKRARPRYPSADTVTGVSAVNHSKAASPSPPDHSKPEQRPESDRRRSEADEGVPGADHSKPVQSLSTAHGPQDEWRKAIEPSIDSPFLCRTWRPPCSSLSTQP